MLPKYSIEHITRVFPNFRDYGHEIAISPCPNCADERYKFWINPKKGVGYCFVCSYSPRLETLLGLAEFDDLSDIREDKEDEGPEPLPALMRLRDVDLMHPMFSWLHERRMTVGQLEDLGAMYCHKGRHWKRIVFPFFGPYGQYRGFQGRYISSDVPEKIPKWTTARGTKKSEMLWNFERVKQNQDWCVLTEGIFDAIRLNGIAVAMLGKKPSAVQKELLEYFRYIFLMLDADAVRDAYKMAPTLVEDAAFRVTVVPLEKGDPDDHETEELVEKIVEYSPAGFNLFS